MPGPFVSQAQRAYPVWKSPKELSCREGLEVGDAQQEEMVLQQLREEWAGKDLVLLRFFVNLTQTESDQREELQLRNAN